MKTNVLSYVKLYLYCLIVSVILMRSTLNIVCSADAESLYPHQYWDDKSIDEVIGNNLKLFGVQHNDVQLQAGYTQFRLGFSYHYGLGVQQNDCEALKHYRYSADQGNTIGQCKLGNMFRKGVGVEKNYGQALRYYRLAADQGCPIGHLELGGMYWNGFGVEKDYNAAIPHFRASAEKGCVLALYNLGLMYHMGWGVEKNDIEAHRYYCLVEGQIVRPF